MHFITNGYRTLSKDQLDRSKATCSFKRLRSRYFVSIFFMQFARHTRPEGHFKVWATIVVLPGAVATYSGGWNRDTHLFTVVRSNRPTAWTAAKPMILRINPWTARKGITLSPCKVLHGSLRTSHYLFIRCSGQQPGTPLIFVRFFFFWYIFPKIVWTWNFTHS